MPSRIFHFEALFLHHFGRSDNLTVPVDHEGSALRTLPETENIDRVEIRSTADFEQVARLGASKDECEALLQLGIICRVEQSLILAL